MKTPMLIGRNDVYLVEHTTSYEYRRFLNALSPEDREKLEQKYLSPTDDLAQEVQKEVGAERRTVQQTLGEHASFTIGRTGKFYFHRKRYGEMEGDPEIPYHWINEVFDHHIEVS